MRRMVGLILLTILAGCGSSTVGAKAPVPPGESGWQYVVDDQDPSVIVYEGTYPHALAWAKSHHGATTIYQLPKGRARCNPTTSPCSVR